MARPYFNVLLLQQNEKERRKIHRRTLRDSTNPFELPETEFRRIFRATKPMVIYICHELEHELRPLNSNDGFPVHLKVLTSLRLLGHGSYQRGTGQDHVLCIAQTTVSKYLKQFVAAVTTKLLPLWVVFPGDEESRRRVARGFYNKHGLPDILGAIDCTHISIFPPPGPQHVQWLNRKNVHTINVQLVVDVDTKILSINSRFPGRVHDQFIFNNSNIKAEMKRLHDLRIGNYYLLGDSGYALEPWMMTPILESQPGSPQERYTKWHCQVRNVVERGNGYLKGIFRCLGIDRALHYAPEKASQLMATCAVLYNIMLSYRVPIEPFEGSAEPAPEPTPTPAPAVGGHILRLGQQKRDLIINTYFS